MLSALANTQAMKGRAAIPILLIEDDAAEALLISQALGSHSDRHFNVECVDRLVDAIRRLGQARYDVVLLDLQLPDALGLEAFEQVFRASPSSLILILASENTEELARQAVRSGAQDYFVKGHGAAHWLPRALGYLIERKAVSDALHDSEARFHAMSDSSPLGIFVSDVEGRCVYTNAAYQKITGLSLEQTLGTNWSVAIHPEDRQRVLEVWRAAVFDQTSIQTEFRILREDGGIVWTRVNSAAMRYDLGSGMESHGRVKTVEDITERKATELVLRAAEEALYEEKERAQVTLNSIGDAVITTDLQGHVTYMNQVAETMTGWVGEEALGRPLVEVFNIIGGTTRQLAANPAQRAIVEDRTVGLAMDSVLIRRDGSEAAIEDSAAPIHNRDGQVAGAVIVFHDVSESRAMALRMAHLAQHDFLTDLPNRVLLTERLQQAIGLANRHKHQVALLFLDLDYFKHINDSLGHAVGDQLLQSVAARLTAAVRNTDTVCRQGGDEFVILLAEIERSQDATYVAEKLIAAFALPHHVCGHELHVTLSIGISIYPVDASDVDAVMQTADTAMFHAKSAGRNRYQFYRSDMNTNAIQRLLLEGSLRRALRQEEFVLHYQPQIELASGTMIGAEALIRWQDPEDGLVYPAKFVPIAEESGLIVPIGRWVLGEACRQVKAWLDAGLDAVPVAVNISAVEFRHKDFIAGVANILKETGLDPAYLELELTESILMQDASSSEVMLHALKAMGVHLAIDDFGTGYSSLSYLKRFPIDTLKIDQSFVHDLNADADSATIVSAVIGMGSSLKQRVIAEGVETLEQHEFLKTHQCDVEQGYRFSHPLPADVFARLMLVMGRSGPCRT